MRLLQLKLINFKQYRNLGIDFSDGLTGIVGSNGAGKSTIFDAERSPRGKIFSVRLTRAVPNP